MYALDCFVESATVAATNRKFNEGQASYIGEYISHFTSILIVILFVRYVHMETIIQICTLEYICYEKCGKV